MHFSSIFFLFWFRDNDTSNNCYIEISGIEKEFYFKYKSADSLRHGTTHIAPCSVAAVALLEEEPHTAVGEDALLHGEALLVVSSGDSHHVSLELISEGVGLDLLAHTLLIERSHLHNK